MEVTATANTNAADEDDMDVVKEATWMLRHNDTLTQRIAIEANWDLGRKGDDGEERDVPAGSGLVLKQVDTLRRRPLPGRKLAPLDCWHPSSSSSSESSDSSRGTEDSDHLMAATPLSPAFHGKFRRRCMQVVRLSASVQGLPAAVAEAGTFLRVSMQNTELGNDLAGRQVVTAPEYSPNPEYVADGRPLFFHVEDSEASPASQGIMVIDIFQIQRSASIFSCRCSTGPRPVLFAKVQILLKDIIGRGHKPQTFHSALRTMRRGRLVDVGTLEAKVSYAPGNGRCVLGICQDHKVFNHNNRLCFVVDKLEDEEDPGSLRGVDLSKGFCIRKVRTAGTLGIVEARSIPRPDGGADLQIWDHGGGGFVNWASVLPSIEETGAEPGRPAMVVQGHMMPTLSLEPLQCAEEGAEGTKPFLWGPAALSTFPASAIQWWENPVLPPGASISRFSLLGNCRANQWSLMEGESLPKKVSNMSVKNNSDSNTGSGRSVKSILKPVSKFSHASTSASGKSELLEAQDGPDTTDRERTQQNVDFGVDLNSAPGTENPEMSLLESGDASQSDSDSDEELTAIRSMSRKAMRTKSNRSMRQLIQKPDKPESKSLSQQRETRSIMTESGRLAIVKGVHFNVDSESFRNAGINGSALPGKQLVARVFHGMPGKPELKVPLWQGQAKHSLIASHGTDDEGLSTTPAAVGTVAAVVEFDFEKQMLAPVILALAVEMQRRTCASVSSSGFKG